MRTRFLLQQAAGELGTLAVGGTAQQIGLRLSLFIAAAIALAAWAAAGVNRARIVGAFQPVGEAVER
jgi:hypothetical protein